MRWIMPSCVNSIEKNIKTQKTYLEENILEKENIPEIPETGMAVLQQLTGYLFLPIWIYCGIPPAFEYHKHPS